MNKAINFNDMDPYEFDVTDNGWRIFDNQDRPLDGAKVILDYIRHNQSKITGKNPSIEALYFHAGQEYAMAGSDYYQKAIECFEKSYETSEWWNAYVSGTIAFLKKDIDLLQKAREKGTYNAEILHSFELALSRGDYSYKNNYHPGQDPTGGVSENTSGGSIKA